MTIRSMTGFGRAAEESARFRVRVTLRSVNHRFLDLALRVRDEQRRSEPALRELLAARLSRGRVEVNVDVEPLGMPPHRLEIDQQAVHELTRVLDELVREEVLERGLTAGDLLRMPQIVQLSEEERLWDEEDERLLLRVAERALDELMEARGTEGRKLEAALTERLEGLRTATETLREAVPRAREEAAEALRQRLEALLGERELDEDRLAQEVAVLADKTDVGEEVDRLGAHLEHFAEILAGDGAVGKRLDFLTQEIFRELNTLGAKGRNSGITRIVLDAKVLCEQLREQVQNVE
ncbi:MAG: YicC/YloC family endoribonuclease [Acidobacteriota bacterium]|jgi:uncharacterized protein (TIGR00255 family)